MDRNACHVQNPHSQAISACDVGTAGPGNEATPEITVLSESIVCNKVLCTTAAQLKSYCATVAKLKSRYLT